MSAVTPLDTVNRFFRALESLDEDTLNAVLSDSPDFGWYLRPASVGGSDRFEGLPAKPNADKPGFITHLKGLRNIVKTVKFAEADELLHTVANETQVVVHTWSKGELLNGQPYSNEYMWLFNFDGEGRIVKIVEFIDSHLSIKILAGQEQA
ncbi:hypothetical protein JCM10207_003575 [Rhodosporidiobolus poonsookiae]